MTNKIATPIQIMLSPGPKPNGLQASEEGLWVIDQETSKVSLLNWGDGKVIKEFFTETDRSSGITIDDNGDIWIASTYNCKIYKVSSLNGETIGIYDSPGLGINATREHLKSSESTGDHGLEWKNGILYVASPPSQYIHHIKASNWEEVGRTKTPGFRPHGIAWAKEPETIWAADTAMGIVSRIRLSDGRVYDVFRVPETVEVHGMTIWNNKLWYCDDRRPIGVLEVNMNPDF